MACDVLSSVDGNVSTKRVYRRKVLGDSYPMYYFHLRNIIQEQKNKGHKFLYTSDVLESLDERMNESKESEGCCPKKKKIQLDERDLKEAIDFLVSIGKFHLFKHQSFWKYFGKIMERSCPIYL